MLDILCSSLISYVSMSTTNTFDYKTIQDSVIEAIKQAQSFTLDAVRSVSDTVAPLVADLPRPPFADQLSESLPTPEEAVNASFAFVTELLSVQKDFADQLIKALYPVRSAAKADA